LRSARSSVIEDSPADGLLDEGLAVDDPLADMPLAEGLVGAAAATSARVVSAFPQAVSSRAELPRAQIRAAGRAERRRRT
jgi:dihydroxyacetone kinase DhaKLM complex PTS-EIIA-like component DhaM